MKYQTGESYDVHLDAAKGTEQKKNRACGHCAKSCTFLRF